ncbi:MULTISPECIES: S-type pyocin domain-containing protein [Pseudomonas]|uniref:S-type pyocin domain-containing protein n=1 Tax=Pseudomonas TaxID=286 RepID=UPI001BEC2B87|nr:MULTISPECIES: S-type pyocin domain-containing protein [Pseudomonas]MBT2341266.1 S-type pyocin domain-containing protein [Pseudomonas fluorescens]MCD4531874.1 S-type pyocin domain-containing protein [Pseudomonas sp. C3-2018]
MSATTHSASKGTRYAARKNILVNRGIPRSPSSPFGFGFSGGSTPNHAHWDRAYDAVDHAIAWLIDSNDATEKSFQENIQNIIYITDTELAKTRAAVSAVVPPGTDALDIESRTLKLQLFKARSDHQEHIAIANLYYGHDPLTHRAQDTRLQGFELIGRRGGHTAYYNAIAKWNVSYAAAYEAKFLAEQIRLMDGRLVSLDHAIAEAKARAAAAAAAAANAAAQARAQAEANRIAEERARMAAEAERMAALEVAAAQAKAQAEAKRAAEEQTLETIKAEAVREAARLAAETAAQGTRPYTFPSSASTAVAGPVLSSIGGNLSINSATASAITATLRSAVSALLEVVAATAGPAVGGIAALLYSSELGNSDLYAMSVPLSELSPDNADDLHLVATLSGELSLPVILGSKTVADKTEFVVAGSVNKHSRVPVRLAIFDTQRNIYKAYAPNAADFGMTWTPIVAPGDASTVLPASVSNTTDYNGITPIAGNGRIDIHPELDRYSFGGFITVFPADSGIPPLYTVFSSPYEGATTKGEHTGRRFNPEQAGGPIIELDWRTATITQKGIEEVKLHIARLSPSDANSTMVERLESILSGKIDITDTDQRYYTHEIRELERFRALGLADDFAPEVDSPYWNNAHTATLEDYKIQDLESLLYTPDALARADLEDERDYQKFLKEMAQ